MLTAPVVSAPSAALRADAVLFQPQLGYAGDAAPLFGAEPSAYGASQPEQPAGAAAPSCLKHSTFRGVTWDRRDNRWRVRINCLGMQHHVGRFPEEMAAARTYDRVSLLLYGDQAVTNFGLAAAAADTETPIPPSMAALKQRYEAWKALRRQGQHTSSKGGAAARARSSTPPLRLPPSGNTPAASPPSSLKAACLSQAVAAAAVAHQQQLPPLPAWAASASAPLQQHPPGLLVGWGAPSSGDLPGLQLAAPTATAMAPPPSPPPLRQPGWLEAALATSQPPPPPLALDAPLALRDSLQEALVAAALLGTPLTLGEALAATRLTPPPWAPSPAATACCSPSTTPSTLRDALAAASGSSLGSSPESSAGSSSSSQYCFYNNNNNNSISRGGSEFVAGTPSAALDVEFGDGGGGCDDVLLQTSLLGRLPAMATLVDLQDPVTWVTPPLGLAGGYQPRA